MLNTYKQLKKQEKESLKLPKTVQDSIPIKKIFKDGIFQLTEKVGKENQFSVTYRINDINFEACSPSEKKTKFLNWEAVLNSFDPTARYKISIFKHKINVDKLQQDITIQNQNNEYDKYRKLLNEVMLNKALIGNGITQEIYLTVSTFTKDVNSARGFFQRQLTQISQAILTLSTRIEQLNATERLRLLHDFYRQGEESNFSFDFDEFQKRGKDARDYICPNYITTENHSADYIRLGDNYCRSLFLRNYATAVNCNIISKLCRIDSPCCLSVDVVSVPISEAIKATQDIKMRVESNKLKYIRKAAEKGMYGAMPTYDMEQEILATDEWLTDLNERDQGMFVANISISHLAGTKEQLDEDTNNILTAARENMCQMANLTFQQYQGLITSLPYGANYLNSEMLLSTEGVAAFLPFRTQEVMDEGGFYFGTNAITGNLINVDFSKLNNTNRFVIGIPGSGKSFGVKLNIVEIFLRTNSNIILLDPEQEYIELVKALGGQIIELSPNANTHINPFDMVQGYGEDVASSYYEKSTFIVSLFEQIDKSEIIGADEKSIIDRCVIKLYKECKSTPTLYDLKELLEKQPEDRAKELALKLELFTTGSLNVFSQQTNIDFTNRIICFDTSKLKGDLQTIGHLIVTDCLVNKVTENFNNGIKTFLFFDEFQTMLRSTYSAQYFNSAWRRYRKRDASPCGITQNIEYLNSDVEFSTMLGNSSFVTLYQLTPTDIDIVADIYNLSAKQLKYVSETAVAGNGLMRIGGNIIPFNGQFPKDNELYNLMSTKAGEW